MNMSMSKSRRQEVGKLLRVTGTHEDMDRAISQLSANELAEVITTMESFGDMFGLETMDSLILLDLKASICKKTVTRNDENVTNKGSKMSLAQAEALYKADELAIQWENLGQRMGLRFVLGLLKKDTNIDKKTLTAKIDAKWELLVAEYSNREREHKTVTHNPGIGCPNLACQYNHGPRTGCTHPMPRADRKCWRL